jgi:hypothetical protein
MEPSIQALDIDAIPVKEYTLLARWDSETCYRGSDVYEKDD